MTLQQIGGPIRLDLPADAGALFLVRCLIERLAERLEFSTETAQQLVLAVDEACTNVIRHAYGNDPEQRILMALLVSRTQLEVQIRDFGAEKSPDQLQPRDLREIRPGGLGLHFMRTAFDHIEYQTPPEGGGTLLKMVKRRPQPEAPPS